VAPARVSVPLAGEMSTLLPPACAVSVISILQRN
jgi:hypothetical protein